ncbi:GntR family transcriptional regulator [Frankia sp. CNm7]|uniref:GntR family transcriptional regulator n=1 Tax=Frankia nepalensis TaxID=1836974 RepID=A0A937RJI0_9ACTN|nr:GntR family transcriptional regulator [Frankia nepalensis]MBL7495631.1 GntR family transcriptional regulator [Frankia nepalensis]MBL7508877.1 GntR family transcriptional regulator [Frankia nepalensis]MBL7520325.1 GntR family transcriptional regulator [Frankia nepalensis]MBL7630100.1 GntR family transcriptional regulator [Frankia nepalensis]
MIQFRLDSRSGVPTYMQLVLQVRQAVRLGVLRPGDQLPTVKEVVETLAINPNTVLKAYRQLDGEGLVEGRRGQGTYVTQGIAATTAADDGSLREELLSWVRRAQGAGLDEEDIDALVASVTREAFTGRVA